MLGLYLPFMSFCPVVLACRVNSYISQRAALTIPKEQLVYEHRGNNFSKMLHRLLKIVQ